MISKNNKERGKKKELINFYELDDVKALKPTYHNPNYESHKINIPFRMLIVAYSGGGKTNFLMNLLQQFDETFNKILLVTRNADEPLYNWMRTKIDKDMLEITEGLDDFNEMNFDKKYAKNQQVLVIFDDIVMEKNQRQISKLFLNARKLAGGISIIYLAQSYYDVPKFIRSNITYIVLKKLNGVRGINMLLRDYNICEPHQLINMYKTVMAYRKNSSDKGLTNMILIDIAADKEHAFRLDFDTYLNPEDFNEEI
jgi:hypothetical protein